MEKGKLTPIVIKAKSGDKTALNTLFTETYNSVYFFTLKTVKDETLAADITQETFVTIFQNLDTLNDPVAYPAWSRQITYRHCLQYLKKQNRETTVDENEDGSTIFDTIEEDRTEFIPDEQLDKEDFKKTILNIVDSLPEEQRTSVILYYYDELSVKQIAEIQGVTEGTVKSRLNYARKTIKSAVETYEKKNNVKLHSVGVLPLLLWLFGTDAKACTLPTATATTIASGISTATGTTISLSKTVQISSKLLGALWQKIVAGLVAVAIVTGGTVAVVNIVNKQDTQVPQDGNSIERTDYNVDGTVDFSSKCKYNEEGDCIKETRTDEYGESVTGYEYNEYGNTVKTIYYNDEGKAYSITEYKYDEKGTKIDEETYRP